MKKTLTTTSALIAATTLVGTTVSAEEVATPTTPEVAETVETPAEVTEEAVQEAEVVRDETQAEADAAQTDVDDAQVDVDEANDIVAELEAEVKAGEEATPEVIAEAQNDAVDKMNAEREAGDAMVEAQNTVDALTEEKEVADAEVETAQTELNEATKAHDEAVAEKQLIDDALDPAKVQAAETALATAEQDVTAKQTAVTTATQALDTARQADATRQTNIDQAKTQLDQAAATKAEKERLTKDLKAVSDQAKAAYDAANKPAYDGFRTDIKLSQGFVDAFKEYMHFQDFTNNPTSHQLYKTNRAAYNARKDELRQKVYAEEMKVVTGNERAFTGWAGNTFGIDILRDNINYSERIIKDPSLPRYDVNNLPPELNEELNLYAVDILNSIRTQFGLTPLKANRNTMAFAQDIAKEVVANNINTPGHYDAGIMRAAAKHGLDAGGNWYENLDNGVGNARQTRAELFTNVADSIVRFFYEGDLQKSHGGRVHYGHAESLYKVDSGVGIALSNVTSSIELVKLHVISVTPYSVDESVRQAKWGNSDATAITPRNDIATLKRQYDTALANYANANGELLTATVAHTTAKRQYDTAVAVPVKTPTAQATLTQAQTALTNAIATRDVKASYLADLRAAAADAGTRLADVTDRVNQTSANKAQATTRLQDAKAEQTRVANALTAALAEVNAKRNVFNNAQAETEKAIAKVTALETARDRLDDNRQALANAKTSQADALNRLLNAQTTLTAKRQVAKEAYNTWARLKAQYDIQVAMKEADRLAKEKAEAKARAEEGRQGQPTRVTHTNRTTTQATVANKPQAPATLPTTGEHQEFALFSAATVAILSSLGLMVPRKKEHND